MSIRKRRAGHVRFESLEQRTLFAGAPLLVDFGTPTGATTTYNTAPNNISTTFVAGSTITTPGHQTGVIGTAYKTFNNIGAAASSSLVYGDNTAATGVTLDWGQTTTSGGTLIWGTTGLTAGTATAANTANKEFDNPIYRAVNHGSGVEQAVRITGLAAGSYQVFFTANAYSPGHAVDVFTAQIGTNLTNYDSDHADVVGASQADGAFSAFGDYVTNLVTINAGDSIVVVVHGPAGVNPLLNMLEIAPVTPGAATTPAAVTPMAPYLSSGAAGVNALGVYQNWLGRNDLLGHDIEGYANWTAISTPSSIISAWQPWKAAVPGRKLVLGVPMLPDAVGGVPYTFADEAAGTYNSKFTTLAQNLLNAGLDDSIIRLGQEFNGGWFGDWTPDGSAQSQTDFKNAWNQIVTTMRAVAPNLKFAFNPSLGVGAVPAFNYLPSTNVDYIALDVYDKSYLAGTYPLDGITDAQKLVAREKAVNNYVSMNEGLNYWIVKARNTAHVPVAFGEWGVQGDSNPATSHGGFDNPYFVQVMDSIISNPANNVAWNAYFEYPARDGDHRLYRGGTGTAVTNYPLSATKYRNGFGDNITAGDSDIDVGTPAKAGNAWFDNDANIWSVSGAGSDIWGTSDQFHFLSKGATGNTSITARLLDNSPTSKAGIMLRDSSAGNSAFADLVMTNNASGLAFQYRTNAGGTTVNVASTTMVAPTWVKLVRSGSNVFAYYSQTIAAPTANDWIFIGSAAVNFTNSTYRAGLAITSRNTASVATAHFSNFTIGAQALPAGWSDTDVNAPANAGVGWYDYSNTEVVGTGTGLGTTTDQFHLSSAATTGDQVLTTRLDTLSSTNTTAQTGLMFRDSTAADAPFASLLQRADGTIVFRLRATTAAGAVTNASIAYSLPTASAPVWLKLVKSGNSFTAYYATGTATPAGGTIPLVNSWTQLGTAATSTFVNSTFRAGLAAMGTSSTVKLSANFGWTDLSPNPVGHVVSIGSTVGHSATNYIGIQSISTPNLQTNAVTPTINQQFNVVDLGGGYIGFQNVANGLYVTTDPANSNQLKANGTTVGSAAQFLWVNGPGSLQLWSPVLSKFVSVYGATGMVYANIDPLNANYVTQFTAIVT